MPVLLRSIDNVLKDADKYSLDSSLFSKAMGDSPNVGFRLSNNEFGKVYSMGTGSRKQTSYILGEEFLRTSRRTGKMSFSCSTNGPVGVRPRKDRTGIRFALGPRSTDREVCCIKARLSADACVKVREKQSNSAPKGKHYEVGADFLFVRVDHEGKLPLYELRISGSFTTGEVDACDVPPGRGGLHSHPKQEYDPDRKNVVYAWFSEDDIHAVREKMLDETENCILHVLATCEGLYIVSMSKKMLEEVDDVYDMMDNADTDVYRIPLPRPGQKKGPLTPEEYVEYCMHSKKIPAADRIYDINWIPWPESGPSECFEFSFPSCDGACNPSRCTKCLDI